MNIFCRATVQSMKKSRTRTIVTVIGVILSAAMITAVATFGTSLLRYMTNGSIVRYGDWHIAFFDVTSAFVQERARDDHVASTVAVQNIGYGVLNGGENPNKPYLFVAGFSKETFETLPITLVSGRLPENSSEVLIPAHVAANGGVKFSVGDTLRLSVGSRMRADESLSQHIPYDPGQETLVPKLERVYTVVGICERPYFEEPAAPGYTLITAADPPGEAHSLSAFVTLIKPGEVHTYASATTKAGGYMLNNNVLRFMGLSDNRVFNTFLYSVSGIVVAIIMIGSVFLIYNSFNISLNERTQQFGILASVGATPRQLRDSVLFEGLCVGAIGIPVGTLAGIFGTGLVLAFVAGNFGNILYSTVPLALTVSAPAILAAALVSLITILISAYIPARKAASTPVMDCIRQTQAVKIDPNAIKTSKLIERLCGLEGTLALKNFKRNRKRYRSIVLSLMLSVVLFVAASAFGRYLRQAAEQSVVDVDYDICFSTQAMNESDVFLLYDKLKTADGVYESSYQAMMTYSCEVNASDLADGYRALAGDALPGETLRLPLDIQFIEDGEYQRFIEGLGLPTEQYTGENAKVTAVAKVRLTDPKTGESTLSDVFAKRTLAAWAAPQTNGENGQSIDITFIDTFPLDPLPRESSMPKGTVFMAVAPYSIKERFESADAKQELGLTFLSKSPLKSAGEMEAMLAGEGVTAEYTLYNVHAMLELNRNMIFIVDVFTIVFVVMISLIATANVFNTISTNIRLRRRELAMLRSVGLSDRGFRRMMNFECAFYGIKTLLLGLPIAAIICMLIYKAFTAGGGAEIAFTFPWASIGISAAGVFLVVFITMLYATSKIKKENIMDALRDDMT